MISSRLTRFTTYCLMVAAALLPLAAQAQSEDGPHPAQAAQLESAVVKIFSTIRSPDPFRPWSKAQPQEITGSGVVIEGHRILTNAHVVGYASQIQVQAKEGGDKIPATVVAIARGIDLAVIRIDDDSFFAAHQPPLRSNMLPEVKDAVYAYGYPTGGSSLSITKGIVSRIEFTNYNYFTSGLRIQIDAAINPGNSGGPVMAGDKMIGLAFSTATNVQNIGYIIPNEEIELFLEDIADGRYDGKPAMFDALQTLENPALRTFLKLDKSVKGMVVQTPAQSTPSYPLKEWDVITHIGDIPIDNQGLVKIGPDLNLRFQYYVQRLTRNGKVPLTVIRNGKALNLQVPVAVSQPQLVPWLMDDYPSYFIYGPIAFSRATNEFRSAIANNAGYLNGYISVDNPLATKFADPPDASREELVVICAPFFPHKLIAGYDNRFGAVVQSVNGKPVRSLRHLVALLRDLKDDLVVIKFDQRYGENIVLPRKEMLAATDDILNDNGVRSQGSKDMMDVWNGKTDK